MFFGNVDGNLRQPSRPRVKQYVKSVPRSRTFTARRALGVCAAAARLPADGSTAPHPRFSQARGLYPRPGAAPPRGLPAGPGCHVCGAARPGTGGRSAPPAGTAGNRPGADTRERGPRREKPTGPGGGYRGARQGGAAASLSALGRRLRPASPGPPPCTFRPTKKSVRRGGDFFLIKKPFAFKGRSQGSLRKSPTRDGR